MSMKTTIAAVLVLSAAALPAVAEDIANDAAGALQKVERRPLFAGAVTEGFSISLHQAQVLDQRSIEERVDARDPALASPMLRGTRRDAAGQGANTSTDAIAGS
jgi:hypothetical protein